MSVNKKHKLTKAERKAVPESVVRTIDARIDALANDPKVHRFTARDVAEHVQAELGVHGPVSPADKWDRLADVFILDYLIQIAKERMTERFDPIKLAQKMFPGDPLKQAEALSHHADLLEAEMKGRILAPSTK